VAVGGAGAAVRRARIAVMFAVIASSGLWSFQALAPYRAFHWFVLQPE